jgi:hypothetical protein
MVAFSHTTTTSPLTGRSGSLTFETTTVNIISAKDTTLGTSTDTYTSLTTIYSSTTSSVTKVPYISPVATYSSRTDVVQVYTELVQYWTQQLCYSTRYEVFDNSDGVTLAIATAGNGGLVSYRTLSPGEVVGEESYKFVTYDSQIFTVGTENFIEIKFFNHLCSCYRNRNLCSLRNFCNGKSRLYWDIRYRHLFCISRKHLGEDRHLYNHGQ